jgi:hypothetical protein
MHRGYTFVALATAVFAVSVPIAPASAVGYWNVPGNVAQWWGYGWGAGHHACYVLGPISHKGAFAHNHKRLPHPPQPAYGCYDGGFYNYDFRQPQQFMANEYMPSPQLAAPTSPPILTPDTLPIPDPAPAPEAVFSPPVEP